MAVTDQDKAHHYKIVREPIITEKSQRAMGPMVRDRKGVSTGERRLQYAFWVDGAANKIEIRHAIEAIFNVKVERVRTATVSGRVRRARWKRVTAPPLKKAWVTLKEGDAIEFM